MNHTYYNTSSVKKERAKTALSIIALLIMIALTIVVFTHEEPVSWDVSYPMTNAKIEWEGAGYNVLYGTH